MKRFLLYGHGGAYNHGAEASAKETIKLIREKHNVAHISIVSHFPEQDIEFGVDADEFFSPLPGIWDAEMRSGLTSEKERLAAEMYSGALLSITPDTVCLSVGGDNFCYPNWHRLAVFQRAAAQKGARSILWGCSVEPSAITPEMAEVLGTYTFILARESRTLDALKKTSIDSGIQLIPDPAFMLEPEKVPLPGIFHAGDTIGINIGPLIERREPFPGAIRENVLNLISCILGETKASIALIPHVMMPMDNDHMFLSQLEKSIPPHFRSRVWLASERHSAANLKYLISKCRFLVCSRMHAAIAAYSSGVPAMVIGYSVKSAGIAEDLGMGELVISVSEIKSAHAIWDMFAQNYGKIDTHSKLLKENLKHYNGLIRDYLKYI